MKKVILILVTILFVVSLAGVGFCEEADKGSPGEEVVVQVNGVIDDIDADSGQVNVTTETGEILMLTASADVDLKNICKGDQVCVQCTLDRVIKSITKGAKSE